VQFSFAGHTLDVDRRELRRGSELIPVEPQVFDVLVYLIRNRGRVVSRDDLLAGVWGARIVSDSTLTSRINAARKAVGDSGEEQRLIEPSPARAFASWRRFPTVPTDLPRGGRSPQPPRPTSARSSRMPFAPRPGALRSP
jgi:hypothetical protein